MGFCRHHVYANANKLPLLVEGVGGSGGNEEQLFYPSTGRIQTIKYKGLYSYEAGGVGNSVSVSFFLFPLRSILSFSFLLHTFEHGLILFSPLRTLGRTLFDKHTAHVKLYSVTHIYMPVIFGVMVTFSFITLIKKEVF